MKSTLEAFIIIFAIIAIWNFIGIFVDEFRKKKARDDADAFDKVISKNKEVGK